MSGTTTATTKSKDPAVRAMYDALPAELSIGTVIKCGNKTETYSIQKEARVPLSVLDNELAFERVKLEVSLYKNKAYLKVTAKSIPMELALHTMHGRAYVSTEDGLAYKHIAEGDVKIAKAAKGVVEIKTSSSVCEIL